MYRIIDINCDVGEGFENEEAVMPYISSCTIACGGHAGDIGTMRHVVELAKHHRVQIGAHPSYPDKIDFGRKTMDIAPKKLKESIQQQLYTLESVLVGQSVELHHIKAHGALYNDIAKDAKKAMDFLKAIETYKNKVFLYVACGSVIAKHALDQGFNIKWEAFADRNYNRDLSLVSRNLPNALITEPKEVLDHLLSMVLHNEVKTVEGLLVNINADTYCIHGDTPNALEILMYLSTYLSKYKITLKNG